MAKQKNQNDHLNVEEVVTQSEAFIIKHKTLILGVVIGIILIVAGFLMYKNLYSGPREEKAQAALFPGQEYFSQSAYQTALNGDSLGYIGFIQIADQYSGTDAANLANAYAGLSYKNLNKPEEAVKWLDKFNGKDQMVSPAILGAIGNCYADLEQYDKASPMLLKAADKADNNTLSPLFLMQAGNILVKEGKYDDAVKAYTKIKEKYFQSFQAQAMDIDKYIERARMMKK